MSTRKRNAAVEAAQEVQEAVQASEPVNDTQTPEKIKEPAATGLMYEITADVVNVRNGSGVGFFIVATLKKGDTVEISEVLEDGWGRLANGLGFINLVFARRA